MRLHTHVRLSTHLHRSYDTCTQRDIEGVDPVVNVKDGFIQIEEIEEIDV